MKRLATIALMFCFTLTLCTVGKAAPATDKSPPGPKTETVDIVKINVDAVTVFEKVVVADVVINDIARQSAEVPVKSKVAVKYFKTVPADYGRIRLQNDYKTPQKNIRYLLPPVQRE